ncbi:hypothetical protein RHMOL_Rhmol05G0283700 [Rhododendron molle]|uniref:Uncharacterized protein n=1 Tax=Rhododendron molle TaxID=49168 RepID=A0ACC0NVK8_RHOML|nr:hypothetical protein RHMOL_Rhmol05G0283700 [Rhododendron molle]
MASSSFSRSPSSRSPSSGKLNNQAPICYCGEPAPLRTSNIPSSMGRRFYGCGRFPKAKCNFFVWVDLPPCDCGRDELLQNIDQLERELEKSKAEERRQRGMFVATWVAIFCFMVLYLTK